MEKENNLMLISIVAIVAIVGMVFMFSGNGRVVSGSAEYVVSEEGDLAGQAIRAPLDRSFVAEERIFKNIVDYTYDSDGNVVMTDGDGGTAVAYCSCRSSGSCSTTASQDSYGVVRLGCKSNGCGTSCLLNVAQSSGPVRLE